MPPKKSKRGRGGAAKSYDVSLLYQTLSEFKNETLPSYGDVIRYARHVRSQYPKTLASVSKIVAQDVTTAVFEIWESKVLPFLSSSVVMSFETTYIKISRLLEDAKELNQAGKGNSSILERLSTITSDLFDLFICR